MELNRRDLLKSGAAGFLLGFLFRGRSGKLVPEPEVVEQAPSAVTITTVPQQAFRPERLVIAGTVVGTRMVPEKKFVPCLACEDRDEDVLDEDEDYDYYDACTVCGGLGGTTVETGALVEENVTVVPWTIESITIGAQPQLAEGGIPGDLFSTQSTDTFVTLAAAQEGTKITMVVRYTGDKPEGEVFRAALIGTSVGSDGLARKSILPICSEIKVVA